jgi:hypothetical protein
MKAKYKTTEIKRSDADTLLVKCDYVKKKGKVKEVTFKCKNKKVIKMLRNKNLSDGKNGSFSSEIDVVRFSHNTKKLNSHKHKETFLKMGVLITYLCP